MVWNSSTDCVLSCFCLQVFQYNVESRTWSEIGKLQIKRVDHAIAVVNLAAFGCVGNHNPIEITIIIIISIFWFPIFLQVCSASLEVRQAKLQGTWRAPPRCQRRLGRGQETHLRSPSMVNKSINCCTILYKILFLRSPSQWR